MDSGELRQIEELITIYELEESMFDVFTEGEYDKGLIRQFLASNCMFRAKVAVHAIDELNVTGDLVRSFGLLPGNRAEVITLCKWIEQKMGYGFDQAVGIIDADFDHIRGTPSPSPLVVRTDYSCAEMYMFQEPVITKLFHIAFSKANITASEFIELLTPLLNRLFVIRLVGDELALACEWPELKRFINFSEKRAAFEEAAFLRQYLGSRGKMKELPKLQQGLAAWSARLPKEGRLAINGHDMIECLGIYLSQYYGKAADKERLRPTSLGYAFACCMEDKKLRDEPMLFELVQRLRGEFIA
jgi:hypothetical protein